MRLLVGDLLAERKGFGKGGVREIVRHFSPNEVFLWSPHTDERLDNGCSNRFRTQQPLISSFVR